MVKEKDTWSPEQIERISKWLEDKWGEVRPCHQCGNAKWLIGDAPGYIGVSGPKGNVILGSGYPCAVVICAKCGNTILLNQFTTGLRSPEKEADDA